MYGSDAWDMTEIQMFMYCACLFDIGLYVFVPPGGMEIYVQRGAICYTISYKCICDHKWRYLMLL